MDFIQRHRELIVKILCKNLNKDYISITEVENYNANELISRYEKLLADGKQKTTQYACHRIKLKTTEPIKQRYYPVNPAMQEIINQEIDKMLADDVIEPSHSPYSSPVVMIRKPDGKYRFCIDFRKINEITERDAYPLPYINAILDKLRGSNYFTTLDLKNGYWQVPLEENSKKVTAFTVPGRGLYQFKVMPFGLHSAPATFQRLLDKVLGDDMDGKAFAYIDDIIILGNTLEEHLENIENVVQRLKKANLKLNFDKCNFLKTSIKYLGHIVSNRGIETDPEKVQAVIKIPPPKNIKQLRRFLGITSWYRRFIPDFSTISSPLTELLKKKQKWIWSASQQQGFEELKNRLTRTPVLISPDFSREFTLQTDACDLGLGVALTQEVDGNERVVAYASRSLTKHEKNYSVTEKECLAIIWGVTKMRKYIEGYHFKIKTDHQSLKWLKTLQNPTGRLARWIMLLQDYDYEILYRKGKTNVVADALSRDPLIHSEDTEVIMPMEITNDEWYDTLIRSVENNPGQYPDYTIRNGKLFRHFWEPRNLYSGTDTWKLCVPERDRNTILNENHDKPEAGHLGVAKTIFRVCRHYFWPRMAKDIRTYVTRCQSCQRYKVSQQQSFGQMNNLAIKTPWHTISIDFIGPLPVSSKRNQYALVVQDRFTKWLECFPLRRTNAPAVCELLEKKVFMRFGCCKTCITDNDTVFESRLFKSFLRQKGIYQASIALHTPQANPTERGNRVIKTMIAQMCEENQRKWDEKIEELIFAYNTSPHESTKYSPAYLNFGRELDAPGTLWQDAVHNEETLEEPGEDLVNQRINILLELNDCRELVKLNLARAFNYQRKYFNKKHKPSDFKKGDKVMKREYPSSQAFRYFSAKLAPKFSGPYIIDKVITRNIFELVDSENNRFPKVHCKDLKHAH